MRREHISHVERSEEQRFLQKQLEQEEQLLDDWIAFKRESAEDFDAWCRSKGRQYSWVKAYYYER
jgi:hypothetical protein